MSGLVLVWGGLAFVSGVVLALVLPVVVSVDGATGPALG
jgi:hypothetical protein